MANIQQADAESPVHYHQNNMYTHLTAYKQPEARDISGTSFFQVNIDLCANQLQKSPICVCLMFLETSHSKALLVANKRLFTLHEQNGKILCWQYICIGMGS